MAGFCHTIVFYWHSFSLGNVRMAEVTKLVLTVFKTELLS